MLIIEKMLMINYSIFITSLVLVGAAVCKLDSYCVIGDGIKVD